MIRTLEPTNAFSVIVANIMRVYTKIFSPLEIAIDLGTATTRMAIIGKGIVLREATSIGIHTHTKKYIFFGDEAESVCGKTPGYVSIIHPVEKSILSDFDSCAYLLDHFLSKSIYPYYRSSRIFKPGIIAYASCLASSTEVEQKATREVLKKVGIRDVVLIEKPYATGYGTGNDIFSQTPSFIIDLGAGTVEIAIIIMGGLVSSKTLSCGGNYMNKLIKNYIHLKYGLIIGALTIEALKRDLFTLSGEPRVKTIRGKSLENGLPKSVRVTTNDIREAVAIGINQIIDGTNEMIETIPPEIIDGIVKTGIILTGESAIIPGLAELISRELKIPVKSAERPADNTILGLMKIAHNKEQSKRFMI